MKPTIFMINSVAAAVMFGHWQQDARAGGFIICMMMALWSLKMLD